MRRSIIGVAVTATFVLGVAASAWAAPAPTGIYQGIVNGTQASPVVCGTVHNEGEGYFKLRRNPNGSRSIVGFNTSNYCGGISVPKIQAPADPVSNCTSMNASFPMGTVIPLTQGAFNKQANVPIGANGTTRNLRFNGHWDPSINRFVGFTRITRTTPSCDTGKKYWRMKRVAAN